eukprot:421051-Prymnesium_polylepis.3
MDPVSCGIADEARRSRALPAPAALLGATESHNDAPPLMIRLHGRHVCVLPPRLTRQSSHDGCGEGLAVRGRLYAARKPRVEGGEAMSRERAPTRGMGRYMRKCRERGRVGKRDTKRGSV